MAYATSAQVKERRGADALLLLTDRDGDGAADDGAIERALEDASAEIDTWLAAKYDLPLSETPAVLTRLAADIAVYRLAVGADRRIDEHRVRYDDAVALLKRIAKGEASLGLKSPGPPSRAFVSSQPRRFTRDSMAGLAGGAPRERD